MQNLGKLAKISGFGLIVSLLSSCGLNADSNGLNSVKPEAQVVSQCSQDIKALSRPDPILPITVTSISGESVSVTKLDQVISLAPGAAEIVWALGLGDVIAGKDLVSGYPGSDTAPTVNPGHEVALEMLLSLNPDLVLADTSDENSDAVQKLTELGIPVVAIPEATSVGEISPRIMAVASALGIKAAGDELASHTEAKLALVSSAAASDTRIAFLYLRGNAGVYLIGGKGSGADSIISSLGAKDAGSDLGIEGFAPLTAEALAKANPDVLLVMDEGLASVGGIEKLLALPGISSTSAAQNSAVIQSDDRLLLAFGPQTPKVISCLAAQLASFSESA